MKRDPGGTMFWLWLFAAHAAPPDTPQVTWATAQQEWIPNWSSRASSATARVTARRAFFSKRRSFEEAFVDLAHAKFTDPRVLRGRLQLLQDRARDREVERMRVTGLTGRNLVTVERARDAALEKEEDADRLERRLLTRLEAFLSEHGELTDTAIRDRFSEWFVALPSPPDTDADAVAAHELAVARQDRNRGRLLSLQKRLVLSGMGFGATPNPTEELRLLSDGDTGAAHRLWLMRGLLDDEQNQAIRDAIRSNTEAQINEGQQLVEAAKTELEGADTALLDAVDSAELEARIVSLDARVAEADEMLSRFDADDPRREPWILYRQARGDRREAAQRMLSRLNTTSLADETAAAATRARREAEEAAARAQAEGAVQQRRAMILGRAADASERVQTLASFVDERRARNQTGQQEAKGLVEEYQRLVDEVVDAGPLQLSGAEYDTLYSRVRGSIQEIAESDAATGARVDIAREEVAEVRIRVDADREALRAANRTPAVSRALDDWAEALDKEMEIAGRLRELASDERELVLQTLHELTQLRRVLRDYVSLREEQIDNASQYSEARRELVLLQPTLVAATSDRIREVLSYPWRLVRDGRLLVDLIWSIFWTLLLLGGWFWARAKATDVATRVIARVRRARPDLKPVDLHRLKVPLTTWVRSTIDLGLGYLMVGRISGMSAEIAFVVECWLLFALFRFFLAIFDLLVVPVEELRPALVALPVDAYNTVRFSVRLGIVWAIARWFTYYVSWTMFGLDIVSLLLLQMFNLVGLALALWQLTKWEPMLRERIRGRNQESRLVEILSRDVYWPFKPFAALVLLAFFTVTLGVDVLYWALARDRSGMSRVFNMVSRIQMDNDQVQEVRIPKEVRDQLVGVSDDPIYVTRPGVDEACKTTLDAWAEEGRRGMIAVVGDRGEGKRTEISRFLLTLTSHELETYRSRFTDAVTTPEGVLRQLAEVAGVEATPDPEELIERLRVKPRAVFVLEQVHRTFVRTVGGFDAFQALLYVLNATSDHHFWLVTLHRPAWNYLSSIPAIVDVGVFRSVVSLKPFDAVALRELCERRCRKIGISLDYRTLMRSNLLGSDPRVELERSTITFYRLLAEASDGNPRVAVYLFADCLQPTDNEKRMAVYRRRALATDVVDSLSVNALFTLVALRQQDAMKQAEIVRVTNLVAATVRNIVRDLQARGLVEQAPSGDLYIPIQFLPLVTRTLRRRHLLYLGA